MSFEQNVSHGWSLTLSPSWEIPPTMRTAPAQLSKKIAIGSEQNNRKLCKPGWNRTRTCKTLDVRPRSGEAA